jgi:hypothetical protein
MRTMFEYKGTPMMVSKADGHWQVRAHGNVYAFRFLDQALSAALPSLTGREVDRLVISLGASVVSLRRSGAARTTPPLKPLASPEYLAPNHHAAIPH